MSERYERELRVRHYECDAYGHVNHATYLRYMQETAFDASAAVGYDLPAYEALGRTWLVHGTEINFLRPLTYGQTVVVRTWVEDFRRATSRRRYELRDRAAGELVAEAHTDWIFLDTATLRPAAIPPEMIAAFAPAGLPKASPRDPFPEQPPPPPGMYQMRRRVRWSDLDAVGHVNNAVYLTYLEDCSLEQCRALGWPAGRMLAEGFGIVGRRYRIRYLAPALLDEELQVRTWLSGVARATAVRHYLIERAADQTPLVIAEALWVWVDLQTGRPVRIPAQMRLDFAAAVSTK